jgi:dipeptide/tripeptide permease
MLAVFGLWGLCMGAEESVEKAVAADFVPEHARALGFGALATVNGIGDFFASVTIGGLWAAFGVGVGFGVSAALCGVGLVALLALLPRHSPPPGARQADLDLLQAEADDRG